MIDVEVPDSELPRLQGYMGEAPHVNLSVLEEQQLNVFHPVWTMWGRLVGAKEGHA